MGAPLTPSLSRRERGKPGDPVLPGEGRKPGQREGRDQDSLRSRGPGIGRGQRMAQATKRIASAAPTAAAEAARLHEDRRRERNWKRWGPYLSERQWGTAVSYTHLRAHETRHDLVCRLLLEKKKI